MGGPFRFLRCSVSAEVASRRGRAMKYFRASTQETERQKRAERGKRRREAKQRERRERLRSAVQLGAAVDECWAQLGALIFKNLCRYQANTQLLPESRWLMGLVCG